MRTRVMWWPLFATMACFAESDTPLGGTEGPGSSGSTAPDDTSASSPTTTLSTTDPSVSASSDGSEVSGQGEEATSVDPTVVDDSGTSNGESGEGCPTGSKPIPQPIPLAWDGATALALGKPGEDQPMCPAGLQSGFTVLGAPFEARCECSCAPGCWVNLHDEDACSDMAVDFDTAFPGTCTTFTDEIPRHVSLLEGDLAADGGCVTPEVSAFVDPGGQHRVCSDVSGDACIVAPDDVNLAAPCISRAGDVPCPDDTEYTERYLVADLAQTACPECLSCMAAAIEACQDGELTVHDEPSCSGTANPGQDPACSAATGQSASIDITLACPAPAADSPELSGVQTFCCVP